MPAGPTFKGGIRPESEPDGAVQKLERAAALCADTPDSPRLQLAELLLAHGHLDKAAEQFQYVLRRSPTNARALQPDLAAVHRVLSELLFKDGHHGEAFAHARLALQLDPADATTKKLVQRLLRQIVIPTGP